MRKQHWNRRLLSLLLVWAMCLACVPEAFAADVAAMVMRLTKTEGTVSISDSSGQGVPIRDKLRLYSGYGVKTEAESYAWLSLDSEKLLKEDAVSQIHVRKSGKKLEVLLDSGNLFFNVQEPLEADEALHIRTSTMAVGIRGTCGWVKVIDEWKSLLYVLEGTVTVTVADPVTGQAKTETVTGGETVTCVVYPQGKAGDKCDILRGRYTTEEIDGFVLADVVPDTGLCEKIYEGSGLDLRNTAIDPQQRLKEDQDRVDEKLADIQRRLAAQETGISMTPVWTNPIADTRNTPAAVPSDSESSNSSSGGSADDGSSGGSADDGSSGGSTGDDSGSSEEPPAEPSSVVTLTMPVTAAQVNSYLARDTVQQVVLQPGTAQTRAVAMPDMAGGYPGRSAQQPGIMQTHTLAMPYAADSYLDSSALQPAAARASTANLLEVDCTLSVPGGKVLTLQPGVSMAVLDGQTLSVGGTLTVGGIFTGTLVPVSGASVRAMRFMLTSPVKDWAVSESADSEGYYALVYAPQEEENVTWRYDEATKTLYIEGSGPMDNYAAPDSVPWNAFKTEIQSLVVAGGVQSIGNNAFSGCTGLKEMHIQSAITSIGSGAFDNCTSLTGMLTIPSSVQSIGNGAFGNCSSLTEVTLPLSVTSIDEMAFNGCSGLTDVYYGGIEAQWKAIIIGGNNDPLLNATIHFAGETEKATWRYDEATKTLYIEGSGPMEDYISDSTPWNAYRTEIQSLVIAEGVQSIGNNAFSGCTGLTGPLTIPGSVQSIGNNAFYECKNLAGPLEIPDSVQSIGNYAFYNCRSLTGPLAIPDGVQSIGNAVFAYCSGLTGPLTIPDSVQSIGGNAFYVCSTLAGPLTIPGSVQSIGGLAFAHCRELTGLTISSGSLQSIGDRAFLNCTGLTGSLEIPATVQTIASEAFSGCSGLDGSLTIHSGSIGEEAFLNCTKLTGLTLSEGVSAIGNKAFSGCSALTGLLEIPGSTERIGDDAFNLCFRLTGLTLSEGITSIGYSAFGGCRGITNPLTIPGSVQSIGIGAFSTCSGLTELTILYGIKSIGGGAFAHCTSLTDVYYSGTEAQWGEISGLDSTNFPDTAVIHYNSSRSRSRQAPAGAVPGASGLVPGYSDGTALGVSAFLADGQAAWPLPSIQNAAMQAFSAPAVRRMAARAALPAAVADLARSMAASAPASGTLSVFSAMDIMCAPNSIAAGPDGTLLVTDTYHKQVWQVRERASQNYAGGETVQDLYGQPLGGYHDSSLKASYFKEPWAIAPFLGGWAVSDRENNVVRLILDGSIQTLNPATSSKEKALGATFHSPTGLASDADGNLYISETRSGTIRRVTPEGGIVTVAKGLSEPMGLCWKEGALYIAETGKNRVLVLKNGRLTTVAGKGSAGFTNGSAKRAAFNAPQGVAVGADGSIYVADTGNGAVRKIQNGTVYTLAARDFGQLECGLTSPTGLVVQGGQLYICDRFARKIFIYQGDGLGS